ncbi:hypothetical protein HS088_TW21G01519 [Tripterygium wilfordii]|uniref:Uncharacterized protein n=1 Tax=Tripterygium wilfordii TaxID=458696 RepID=A0A7J7C5F3_TRIWF|nr:hypothetical protein HS088_TW21G01519 [Tripterygium wilfordii]
MSTEAQRVVVIQDASRNDVSAGAIGWVLQGLSLKPGDVLTLLGILHQVNPPSTFSFKGAGTMHNDLYFHFFYVLHRRISTGLLKLKHKHLWWQLKAFSHFLVLFSLFNLHHSQWYTGSAWTPAQER